MQDQQQSDAAYRMDIKKYWCKYCIIILLQALPGRPLIVQLPRLSKTLHRRAQCKGYRKNKLLRPGTSFSKYYDREAAISQLPIIYVVPFCQTCLDHPSCPPLSGNETRTLGRFNPNSSITPPLYRSVAFTEDTFKSGMLA
jgi:hypothetical protein